VLPDWCFERGIEKLETISLEVARIVIGLTKFAGKNSFYVENVI
jgi:hypothetical protein